ncbi:hypothetical protein L2719_09625 [Shewanella schlegeliana]|uniref:DUF3352 domain-containing protein n=1 Tax=Shewanella schlegeliana TaxID=190308 RepID=A0ABS1SVX2_9GAMM|nr:hypothetical protein [Shewanella schlegeliana]MBL4912687.1 hypothetical protein [Shewanella schlegeliana]MCL1109803.1 hypothetical protein [Shewanella schlegeliana]GIU30230.1 hypothetical protein TUM4433_20450 [Shewanella schlegeliana]
MNKMLIAAVVVAAGAGGYWYSQQSTQVSAGDNPVLSYVPADTPIFSAQLQPFPIKSYINSLSEAYRQYPIDAFDELEQDLEQENDARAQFFVSLMKSYMASMKDGSTFIQTFGLAENIRSYFYTLGAMPVVKVDIDNPDAFWALLDKAEVESGFTHTKAYLKGVDYRSYRLTDATEQDQIDWVFAVHDGLLISTLSTSFSEATLLETAFGVTPIDNSIVDAHIIEDIINKYGFTNEGISYINHKEIVTALTTTDGNQLAGQLSKLFEMSKEDPFAELKTPACQQELSTIADNWPRTVAGYDLLEITDKESNIGFRAVIESQNQVLLNAYQKLRGYIPAYTQDIENSVFTLGVGIDTNQMVPSLNAIWDDMLTPEYQCAPLEAMQAQMSQQSPGMLGMFTGMANGVKGVAVSLIDYKISDDIDNPQLESLDAVMTLSADNPSMLFNLAKPFVPELGNVQLPVNGDAIDLNSIIPMPPEMNFKAKMAIKGNHLVIFAGNKGEAIANSLATEPVVNNGLMVMSADYMKMFKPLLTFIELTGEPVPEGLEAVKDYDMRVKMSLDVDQKGFEVDSLSNSRSTE